MCQKNADDTQVSISVYKFPEDAGPEPLLDCYNLLAESKQLESHRDGNNSDWED